MAGRLKTTVLAIGRGIRYVPGVNQAIGGVSEAKDQIINKTVMREISGSPRRIMSMVQSAAGHGDADDGPAIPNRIEDAKARFDFGVAASGLTEEDLVKRETALTRQFWVMAFAAVFAMAVIIVQSGRLLAWGSLPSLFFGISAFVFTVSMAFQKTFFSWQLRTRSLGSVRDFLCSGDWFPPERVKSPKATSSRIAGSVILAVVGASAVGNAAFAATSTPSASGLLTSAQSPTGPTAALLAALTGASSSDGSSSLLTLMQGTGNPVTYAIGVLCGVLFLLGTAMLAYQTIEAVIHGAANGSVLGKSVTHFSMPRISIGVGMLAPVFPNGLAGVHILVLLTMSLGSTIANTAYSAFVTQVISTGNSPAGALSSFLATLAPANTTPGASTAAATMPSQTADTAKSILDMEICYAAGVQAGNNSWPKVTAQQVIGALQPATGGTPDSANANTLWNYGACGSITFPNTVQSSQVAATGASQSDPAITTFITARNAAMGALISSIRSSGLATQIINTFDPGNNPSAKWPTSIATPLVSPVTTYDQTMTQAAATMLSTIKGSQTSKLLTSSQQIGWIGAGLIYRPLFDASAAASSQAHIMPSIDITKPSPLRITGQIIEQATKRATTDWQSQTTLAGISATNFTGPGNSADNLLMRNIDKLSQSLAQAAIQLGSTLTTGSDPLAGLITLGHLMIGMAEGLIVAGLATAALASNGIAGLAGAAGAWSWAAIWLAAAIAWTLGLGITLAFALPIMPFMAVFWAVIAWFTAGAELMIGLPCWAFAMIRMDGDRFINQQQAAGIAALTSLLLRPTVVVCAFGFAYVMLPLELGLFNALFPVAFVAQQGGHVTGIVAILAALTISTRVQWQIVQMSMRAITTWPDRIAHMWGGRAEGHEEHKNTQGSLDAAFGAGAVVGGSLKSGVERGTGIPAAVEKSKDTASKLKAAAEATAARAAMGPGGANGATA